MQRIFVLTLIAIFVIFTGCSGTGSDPAAPVETPTRGTSSGTGHILWGFYQFTADPIAGTLEYVPLRAAEMHLNALPFLEPPAYVYLSLDSLEFNGNIIDANIGLRHPFLGITKFTGFDVCGILITDGSISGFTDSGITIPGAGDVRLLNPDGYSRWWNPEEFPHNTGMLGYKDGLLGTPDSFADFSSTVNGYKYFCDDLTGPDDPLSHVTPVNRGMFSAGQKVVRHYSIDITAGLVFNYAIDASWIFPTGGPPWTAPDDFPGEANRPEAWWIDATVFDNYLWNDGVTSGGALSLAFDVYDRNNLDLNTVNVESPGNFDPAFDLVPTGGGANYSTYELDATSVTPAFGEIQVLITVASEEEDFAGFIPGVNTSAYLVLNIPVSEEQSEPPVAYGTAEIQTYFDGFGPVGTAGEPVPTEWLIDLDASGSTGPAVEFFWEMNGDDLFDDAEGMIVNAPFPDIGTHVIRLKVTNGGEGVDIYDIPGTFEVVEGTYVWAAFSGSSDGSRDNPWTNIPDALTDVGTDGFILVRGDDGAGGQSEYSDDLTLNAAYEGTRIQGYYGNVATDEPPMHTGYVRVEADDITFDGFEVTGPSSINYYPTGGHHGKLGNTGGENVLFRHLYIHDIVHTTDLCKAILCYASGSLTAQNILEVDLKCSYQSNQVLTGEFPELTFINCTMDRLGFDGFPGCAFYISGGTGEVYNSIWTDCNATGAAYMRRANLDITDSYVDYTDTFDTPIPPDGAIYFAIITVGPNCIQKDPLYVDYLTDHHLQSGSPCIDTGDPTITDYDSSPSDMGCYGGPHGDWDFEN